MQLRPSRRTSTTARQSESSHIEIVPEENITQVPNSGDQSKSNETRSPAAVDENAYDAPSRANEIRT